MSNDIKLCKERNCTDMQTIEGYCRLHYIKNWKLIKAAESQKANMPLDDYVKNVLVKKIQSSKAGKDVKTDEWIAATSSQEKGKGNFEDIFSNEEELDNFLEDISIADT